MQYVLGVDGGGSKTAVVILNEEKQELGRGQGGVSNYHLAGTEGAKETLLNAMQEAAADAGITLTQITAATWALAGAARPADRRILQGMMEELLPDSHGLIVTDALAALVGGIGSRRGIVLIAGTGAIAYGENGDGEQARAGGWGHILDHGSGYALAQAALRAVMQAEDGRQEPTVLSKKVQAALQLENISDLVNWIYAPRRNVTDIAALAPLVLQAAEAGDMAATAVIAQEADALAAFVAATARRLGVWKRPFSLLLMGGLLKTDNFYRRVVLQAVRTKSPHAQFRQPQADAATGAALLALEMMGHPLTPSAAIGGSAADWASEQGNVLTEDLDLHSTLEIVGLMHLADRRAVTAVRPCLPAIARAIDAIAARMRQGGRLIYIGAGTSGRLGTLDASECPPTFGTSPDLVTSLMAGGERALTVAIEGAEDDPEAGRQDVARLAVGHLDTVVGIAASGRTPYVIGGMDEARRRGALTVALIANLPAPLAEMADHLIAPLVGAEVLAGSTRLKAGTTQKLVLNMLSTGVMVRLGKTYGNLMVDVRQHNSKLQNRARRIVQQACRISEDEAAVALADAGGHVKMAIVGVLLGCSPDEARERLDAADGVVRTAVG